ncbi:hypothetical protein A3A54_02000 [Candidatus Curtissbacteria bacterium RIFCSPLOWO2_01_FULL_39_62]|uniref:BioF2-like acetyltransferase domain-containing protein n=2 Tax=Candidatus Curtissiibacteriota TaxID=1752717 RepID=A0A1F5GA53_9BACT|nr:MAG: hypothetical protein A2775_01950 [Candidatus Curtissbacteria bacterium RIFCSPHIGHO2_01_FULL_39_57]OGD88763.1 MAG: hypothetical protein A3D04_04365 [Candidatus Curtissbacteria bacterium RIFCSPHIGHO2_02_FULL_40_16b]OGD90539.1 MAG: hypothetical protein A3E11_02695 [Candidatus Curtissbacteria bacterium RIFCSPHIGHO2_12_FULL_38_37]OGD99201.1 MAG: hypothetical protein A3J17_01065 [Candidatus Curtissbacteria bacterium RIFCSPLOWO2_02_FULL_40_11]OGE00968.1 MAG: hypothetical protein A3A54_02000 [C
MIVREVEENEKNLYNKKVNHLVQSWEWGEFRRKTGLDVVRLGHFEGDHLEEGYQLTFHKVPLFPKKIGYFPKGPMPNTRMIAALKEEAKSKNAAFIKLEPNVVLASEKGEKDIIADFKNFGLIPSKKPLFTKWNFLIDLTKSEDSLLAAMHPKTRYNIKVAQRYGVEVKDSTDEIDFDIYLKLYFETTKRQKYFGHTPQYHKLVWETLMPAGMARVLMARYRGKPLVAWMLLNFKDTLYYPYGGSSLEHKEVMASNLIAWEAIRLGKNMGLKVFDMWGALSPKVTEKDPWYGFHKFKAGYGGLHVEYVGTYDLILNNALYKSLNMADRMRWLMLRMGRR